jgi:magnesium transporter
MIYTIESTKITPLENIYEGFKPQRFKRYIAVFDINEHPGKIIDEAIPNTLYLSTLSNKTPRFESHEDLDIMCIKINHFGNKKPENTSFVFIFMQYNLLQFVCEDMNLINDFIQSMITDDINISYGKILYLFFNHLIINDLDELEKIEDEITEIEDEILNYINSNINYSQNIIKISRQLRAIKQYYEQLLNIIENLHWNENNLFDTKMLRYFKILEGKLERLYNTTITLISFATEAREAYQMEVDMRANRIMQLLTVVTVIFLPLTLIVGWYGMNLQMPEFTFKYSYPIIIALSLIVILLIISFFKKRKWF